MNASIQCLGDGSRATATAPHRSSLLQRKCACGGSEHGEEECAECREQREGSLQRSARDLVAVDQAPPIVHDVLRESGQPLDSTTRTFMETRFVHDFSRVRVHTDAHAAESAEAVDGQAYTLGFDVVFRRGAFSPLTPEGRLLLAHELAHVVQQGGGTPTASPKSAGRRVIDHDRTEGAEAQAARAAIGAVTGQQIEAIPSTFDTPRLQRQVFGTPSPVGVRSPAFEEFVTQASTVQAGLAGRPLDSAELRLARDVFAASIDYSRVRLIPTGVLEYRTVANTIRVPETFTIADAYMAQTLIHELTHVWQYQHGGTSYISVSLATQIAGTIRTGTRNAAYDYNVAPGASFFGFTPEQQGMIVQNYFAMLRDRSAPPRAQYVGNHLDASFEFQILSAQDRTIEIGKELPPHQLLIQQMRAAVPRPEADLLTTRATEMMRTPVEGALSVPAERQIAPVKPLLELSF